ncbi:MAG: hypothetical protein OEN01_14260 [Candidatus Krumholzibacteria bacterium]|nr:hypothetical protein [Candidatus Krumholzibacteria bacterium]
MRFPQIDHRGVPWPVVFALLVLGGCSDDSFIPGVRELPKQQADFFPLVTGSEWTYDESFSVRIIPMDGSPEPPPEVLYAEGRRRLTGTETFSGREYTVEHRILFADSAPDTFETWSRYRQDATGLYVADLPISQPPASVHRNPPGAVAAGYGARCLGQTYLAKKRDLSASVRAVLREHIDRGRRLSELPTLSGDSNDPAVEELKLLAYPLRPTAQWTVRAQPKLVVAFVESEDTLNLAAGQLEAYRIRFESELLDEADFELRWYGTCGGLRTVTHLETMATDSSTGEVVLIITEEIEELVALQITGSSRCSVTPNQLAPSR